MKKTISILMITVFAILALCGCNGSKAEVLPLNSQLDALTQLDNGTVDCAVIDSVMAGYYTSTGDYATKFEIVKDFVLTTEQYGIAGRKGDVSFMDKINEGLVANATNGELKKIADFFGVTDSLAITSDTVYNGTGTDSSWNDIVSSGKVVIGFTVFAPIAYTDDNPYGYNNFTGFDIELARAVVDYLCRQYDVSLNIEFQEIDWDSKETLLSEGTIDLIWNGLTITDDRQKEMCISIPYMNNKQVVVVKKGESSKADTKEKLKTLTIGVESGSAGEDCAKALFE